MSRFSRYAGKRILRKRFKVLTRDKCVQNFDTAESAVILFDTALSGAFSNVNKFSKYLAKNGISTKVFGLVWQKEKPLNDMLRWKKFNYISRKDISWYGRPKGEISKKYFELVPDILFVINFEDKLPMDFLTYLIRARFKVGCYTENPNDLDLMIKLNEEDCRVIYLIDQLRHYIKLLNPIN